MITKSYFDASRKAQIRATSLFALFAALIAGVLGFMMFNPICGVICGLLVFGLGLFAVFAINQQTLSVRLDPSEKALGVHQVQAITLDKPYEQAFASCVHALQAMPACRIKKSDPKAGLILAETDISDKSNGELITLTISESESDKCVVTISSKPLLSTIKMDYGKNAENIRAIVAALD